MEVNPHRKRIVLTGGPGAGKTVISAAIIARHPDWFVLVPEAATQVYAALQTRWDRLDPQGRQAVQRQIYQLQRHQEDRIATDHPGKALLLDRGTIDGAAYWPQGPAAYWADLGTSHEQELARYDMIIWLETAAALGIYDGDASNDCRFEDPAAAIESGNRLSQLWGNHPNFHRVPAYPILEQKTAEIAKLIGAVNLK